MRIALFALVCLLATSLGPAFAEQVVIDDFAFAPAQVTVKPGATITWTNRDDMPHTVTDTATPRAFRSEALDTGDSFSFTFTQPGTYHYFCSLHPHMQGTVVVQ